MQTKVYGSALEKRLDMSSNHIAPLVHELVMLCREHKGTLVQKGNTFMLYHKGICRVVSDSVEELTMLKRAFV